MIRSSNGAKAVYLVTFTNTTRDNYSGTANITLSMVYKYVSYIIISRGQVERYAL